MTDERFYRTVTAIAVFVITTTIGLIYLYDFK